MLFKAKKISRRKFLTIIWTCAIFIVCSIFGLRDESFFAKPKNARYAYEHTYKAPASPLKKDGQIRVCAWNLKLYLETFKMTAYGRKKAPKSEEEKAEIIKVLKSINPDVLGVEEIGTNKFIVEFQNLLRENGLSYPYVVCAEKSDEYPHCAILSKIPIKSSELLATQSFEYFDQLTRSPRGILLAKFETNGVVWRFGALHLKSRFGAKKRDAEFSRFRTLECKQISNDILKFTSAPIIIGGDFNDEPKDRAITALAKGAKLKVLPSLNDAPSYVWKKKNMPYRFDFFMVSNAMLQFVTHSVTYEINENASDHAPVFCDLDFSKN